VFAAFLLAAVSLTAPSEFESGLNYFICGDFADLVEVEGKVFGASGFGLTVLSPELRLERHIPTTGYSRKIAIQNKAVYLGDGERLAGFKLKSGRPVQTADYVLPGRLTALAANERFVAAGTDSGTVVLFVRRRKLEQVGSFHFAGGVRDLCFYDGMLYAACGRGGLGVMKVSESPSLVDTLELSGALSLTAAQHKLFVGTEFSEIHVLSLADPSAPAAERRFASGAPALALEYHDGHLYAAQGHQGYSIFDPEGKRVEQKREFREGFVADILPTGHGVYLALRERGVVKLEGRNPRDLEAALYLEQGAPSVHTAGQGAFLAIAQGGVRIARLDGETVTWGVADPAPAKAEGVHLSGTYLYVADADEGALIFSLATFPYAERRFALTQPGTPHRFALASDFILLAAAEKGLRVLWICPCGPLKQRGEFETGVHAADVAVKDSIIYVADPDSGLRVLTLRDEGKEVVELSRYAGAVNPTALLVDDDVLYIADGIGAVAAVDISDPAAPEQLSFTFISARPRGLAKAGSALYVACGEEGVLKVDMDDPKAPVLGGFIETPGRALAVAAAKGHLAVADYTSWVLLPLGD